MSSSGTSFPECGTFYFVHQVFPDAIHRAIISVDDQRYEVDIYIPSCSTVIEYDGMYWHKGNKKKEIDEKKNLALNSIGLYVIRLREMYLPVLKQYNGKSILTCTHSTNHLREAPLYRNAIDEMMHTLAEHTIDHRIKEELEKYHISRSAYSTHETQDIYAIMYDSVVSNSFVDYCGIEFWSNADNGNLIPDHLPIKFDNSSIYVICPNGIRKEIESRSSRRTKVKCKESGLDCAVCIRHILCPFLDSCSPEVRNDCTYVNEAIVNIIARRSNININARVKKDILDWWKTYDIPDKLIEMNKSGRYQNVENDLMTLYNEFTLATGISDYTDSSFTQIGMNSNNNTCTNYRDHSMSSNNESSPEEGTPGNKLLLQAVIMKLRNWIKGHDL